MTQTAIAYIPVLHSGYVRFLRAMEDRGVRAVYLIGDSILSSHEELDYIHRKDRLRAIDQELMRKLVQSCISVPVEILESNSIEAIRKESDTILTPREDIGRMIIETYFRDTPHEYIDIFLRWNKDNLGEDKAVEAHSTIDLSVFEKEVLQKVITESQQAVDWWRQVGAALVKDETILFVTHNEHMPEKEFPNILGDTRSLFKKGIYVNYVTSAHAEISAIAEAAKQGIATHGASLFVTDFPCPYCARLIAKAGIKKLYFIKGYAILDGDTFLQEEGVEVVQVHV